MAIMHPQRLSELVLKDRKLKGEVDTYNALTNLPNEFEVFHNRCPTSGGSMKAYARRIDFIILHEKLGLLAIEVKGGKIRLGADGSFEQYYPSIREWVKIDPFAQVTKALISLITIVRNDGANYWIPDNTCVIFPHKLRRDITNTPHILPNGTLCKDDLPLFTTQIPSLFSKSENRKWDRECFLDLRRRLQNMPEAVLKVSSEKKTTFHKKSEIKKKSKSHPSSQMSRRNVKYSHNEEPVKYVHPKIDYHNFVPFDAKDFYDDYYISSKSEVIRAEKQSSAKLKSWQIVVAIVLGLAIAYELMSLIS